MGNEIEISGNETVPFEYLTEREMLIAIRAQLNAQEARINGALALIEQVGTEVGPILESLQANPMFKMMGFGKRI